MSNLKKEVLILDANAFIHQVDLHKLNEKYDFASTYEAMAEVKDLVSRESLANWSKYIRYDEPSEKSVAYIKKFAGLTGDLASLSRIDINLLALAHTLVEMNGKAQLLKKELPKPISVQKVYNVVPSASKVQNPSTETKVEPEADDSDGWETVEAPQKRSVKPIKPVDSDSQTVEVQESVTEDVADKQEEDNAEKEEQEIAEEGEDEEEDEDEDDGEGWVTCENISDHLAGLEEISEIKDEENKVGVSVLTADFAMQNVLLQVGVPIVSQEGYRVLQARRFMLECHICKQLVKESTKLFCPGCGNNSLMKVSCSIHSDGTILLYRKRNFKVNNRGTQVIQYQYSKFTIPKFQVKTKDQLILREDQLLMGGVQQKIRREQVQADKMYKKMILSYENGFGFDDVDFKQSRGVQKIKVGYGRLNPNDINDMRKIKGKR